MPRLSHRAVSALIAALVLLAGPTDLLAQGSAAVPTLAEIDAPAALAQVVERIQRTDALTRAGLTMPPDIRIELIPESDPRAGDVPRWIVGLVSGRRDIVIFPERVGSPLAAAASNPDVRDLGIHADRAVHRSSGLETRPISA
ncbi:MAG: hypothetical protein ABL986_14015 [Vicinamibacterales bacterium]